MLQNLQSSAMTNPTRLLLLFLIASTCALFAGCNEEAAAPPLEPLPQIHPNGVTPSKALPPSVSAPGTAAAQPIETPPEDETLASVMAEREMFERIRRLAVLLANMGPEGVEAVSIMLRDQDDNTGGAENVLLSRYWALHEPDKATRWAMMQSPLGFRLATTLATMEVWAIQDPIEAQLQIEAQSLMPGANLIAADMGLIRGWFQSEVPGIENYIRSRSLGRDRQRALRILARQAINIHGAEWAADWPVRLPDDDKTFKLNAYRQFGIELAKTHPEVAKKFCTDHCADPQYGDGVRSNIAQNMARRNGSEAMEWATTAPVGTERNKTIESAFRGWINKDRSGLISWMDSMGPEGLNPSYQPLLALYSIAIGKQDAERGIAWASVIIDDETRNRTLRTVAMNWRRNAPEAADAWLETSALSTDDRQAVQFYGRPDGEAPYESQKSPANQDADAPAAG